MSIEITFVSQDGGPLLIETYLAKLTHDSVKIVFPDRNMQELWDQWVELGRVSIKVNNTDPELFESVVITPEEFVYRTQMGIYVQRKRLPGLCRALGLDHSAQIAAALTYMTKHSSKTPDYFRPIAEDMVQDVNLTKLLWAAENPLFQKDFLTIKRTGHTLYHHLENFIEAFRATQISD